MFYLNNPPASKGGYRFNLIDSVCDSDSAYQIQFLSNLDFKTILIESAFGAGSRIREWGLQKKKKSSADTSGKAFQ